MGYKLQNSQRVIKSSGMSGKSKWGGLRFILQLGVAALCLYLAFRGVHLERALEIVAGASLWLVGLACLCTLLMNMAKCVKLGLLLAPHHRVGYGTLLTAELVSVLVDVVFPLRLQEIVKAFVVGRKAGIRPSLVLGAEVVEKSVEVLFLTSVALVIWILVPTPAWADFWFTWIFIAIIVGALGLLLLVSLRPQALDGPVRRVAALRLPGAARFADMLGGVTSGLRLASGRPWVLALVVLATFVEWCFLAGALWLCAQAVSIPLGTDMLLSVLVANFLAFAVPTSTGGSVGIYELIGKSVLVMIFGMDPAQALVLVVLFHGVMVGFGALNGAVALALSQFSFGGMKQAMHDPELMKKLDVTQDETRSQ